MASKKTVVELIALQCSECKRRNYTTSKNRRNIQEKWNLINIARMIESIRSIRRQR